MEKYISQIAALPVSARVERLKEEMLAEPRFVSIEQARIITRVYQQTDVYKRQVSASSVQQLPFSIITVSPWPTSLAASRAILRFSS